MYSGGSSRVRQDQASVLTIADLVLGTSGKTTSCPLGGLLQHCSAVQCTTAQHFVVCSFLDRSCAVCSVQCSSFLGPTIDSVQCAGYRQCAWHCSAVQCSPTYCCKSNNRYCAVCTAVYSVHCITVQCIIVQCSLV